MVINTISARQSVIRVKGTHRGLGIRRTRMSQNFELGEEVELSKDLEEEKELAEQTSAQPLRRS